MVGRDRTGSSVGIPSRSDTSCQRRVLLSNEERRGEERGDKGEKESFRSCRG